MKKLLLFLFVICVVFVLFFIILEAITQANMINPIIVFAVLGCVCFISWLIITVINQDSRLKKLENKNKED